MIRAEIDLDEIGRWRDEEIIYPNRRPLLYREIGKNHLDVPALSFHDPERAR